MVNCRGFQVAQPRHSAKEDGNISPWTLRVKPSKKLSKARNSRAGQTIIEYVLTIALVTLIFGTLFYKMRQSLFNLWVCQIAPRIQAPRGCGKETSNCWREVQRSEDLDGNLVEKCKIQ